MEHSEERLGTRMTRCLQNNVPIYTACIRVVLGDMEIVVVCVMDPSVQRRLDRCAPLPPLFYICFPLSADDFVTSLGYVCIGCPFFSLLVARHEGEVRYAYY